VGVQELALENDITRTSRIRAGQVLRVPAKGATAAVVTEVATASADRPVAAPAPADTPAVQRTPGKPAAGPVASEAAVEIAMAEEQATMAPEEAAPAESAVKQIPSMFQRKGKTTAAPPEPPATPAPAINDSLREVAFAPAIIEPVKTSSERPHAASNFDVSNYELDAVLSPGGTSAKIIVSVDETIGHYADWLGIPTWRIRKLNDMGRGSSIRINRSILIPIDRPDALEQFAAARLEYHMAIEEDFYAQFAISDVVSYTLKRGETLWDLCNNSENPLPMWLLKKYNRQLDLGTLPAGSEVWIPQVRELTEDEQNSAGSGNGAATPPAPPPLINQKARILKLMP
jgi:membrane-bound lytic murein transglycosylase D